MTLSPLGGFSDESDGDALGKGSPKGKAAPVDDSAPAVAASPEVVAAPAVAGGPVRVAIANALGSDSEDYGMSSDTDNQPCSAQSAPSTPGMLWQDLSLLLIDLRGD